MLRVLCFLAVSLWIGAVSVAGRADTQPTFHVVGYLPDYRIMNVDPRALVGVTDVVFTSLTPTADGGIDCSRVTPEVEKRLREIRAVTGARIMISVGGGDRSNVFATMATDPGRRHLFVTGLAQYLVRHHFDGVDYDWEFPNGDAEKRALTDLVIETKAAIAPYHLTLSIATAPWDDFDKRVYAAVDRLNLMTYYDDTRHATVDNAKADTEALIAKGADPTKICMGIPFYGMRLVGSNDDTPGYRDIAAKYHPAPSVDEVDGYAFNGIETVRRKTLYARSRGLGGVMIWELGQDTPDGVLTHATQPASSAKK